jgi:hypothetical protein
VTEQQDRSFDAGEGLLFGGTNPFVEAARRVICGRMKTIARKRNEMLMLKLMTIRRRFRFRTARRSSASAV